MQMVVGRRRSIRLLEILYREPWGLKALQPKSLVGCWNDKFNIMEVSKTTYIGKAGE